MIFEPLNSKIAIYLFEMPGNIEKELDEGLQDLVML